MTPETPQKILFIIDAYNLIYRMFYAIPEMHTRDGRVVNAIFGVAKFLRALTDENPHASIIVASDVGESFRAREYNEYKAQRDRMPDNLRSQIDGVFALFESAGIQILSREGYEADDIIGSIVTERSNGWADYQFIIISSDKDLCQFVRDGHIHIYDAMKRKFMKEKDVLEKFAVPVHQVRDYLAIVGDSSDNIPGIAGFGPKKATDLLEKFASLSSIYQSIGIQVIRLGGMRYEIGGMTEQNIQKQGIVEFTIDRETYEKSDLSPKIKQGLLDSIHNAFLSQRLATIITDLDISLELTEADTLISHIARSSYLDLLREYEFRSLLPKEDTLPVQKILQKPEVGDITSLAGLDSLRETLEQVGVCTLFVTEQEIYLSVDSEVSRIDTTRVDTSEFISWFLESDLEIRGYDLKEDYKRLLAIQKPLQKVSEGQGVLF